MANKRSVLRFNLHSDAVSHVSLEQAADEIVKTQGVISKDSFCVVYFRLSIGEAIETQDYIFQEWAECSLLECA